MVAFLPLIFSKLKAGALKHLLFYTLLFWLFAIPVSKAQSVDACNEVNATWQAIYNFQLAKAQEKVDQKATCTSNANYILQEVNIHWWPIVLDISNTETDSAFQSSLQKTRVTIRHLDHGHMQEKAFLEIMVNAYETRFELINGNYVSALGLLNDCVDEITASFGSEDHHEAFYLTSGLYYYFTAKAYNDHPLLRPYLYFLPEGDLHKGIAYLKVCSHSKDPFIRTEAVYSLMRIYYDLEEEYALALEYAVELRESYPFNPLFALYEYRILDGLNEPIVKMNVAKSGLIRIIKSNPELSVQDRDRLLHEINDSTSG